MDRYRIMIIDGSLTAREIIRRNLSRSMENAEITLCISGKDALDCLSQKHYDLVTTSLLLPDMDGLKLCEQIRESDTHHYTPVIVISGDANSRLLKEGFDAGVTDYFDKSLGYNEFCQFIKDYSHRSKGLVGSILYVEDSKTIAVMTQRIFEKHGLQVTQTTSAEEAYELLKRSKERSYEEYDLVISDFYLDGEMTGGDLLHAIRTRLHFTHQTLPVLIITGKDSDKTQAELFHAGANDFVAKPLLEETLIARVRSLLLIKQQYDAIRRQANEMERLSIIDPLTGARNRRYLITQGNDFLAKYRKQTMWVALLDIDYFKKINDNFGHLRGDKVLMELGQLLNQRFSSDMVIRYGGEEFALFVKAKNPEEISEVTSQLREQIQNMNPDNIQFTISMGVVTVSDFPEADATELVGLADKALYTAKDAGRNCVYQIDAKGLYSRLSDVAYPSMTMNS